MPDYKGSRVPGLREVFKSFKLHGDMIKCILYTNLSGSSVEDEVIKIYTLVYFVLNGNFTFNCIHTFLTILYKYPNAQV